MHVLREIDKIDAIDWEGTLRSYCDATGQILWRRVLEKGYGGRIRTLGGVADGDLISVSGGVPAIVRAWDLATGHILNEWPIAEQNTDRYDRTISYFLTEISLDIQKIGLALISWLLMM